MRGLKLMESELRELTRGKRPIEIWVDSDTAKRWENDRERIEWDYVSDEDISGLERIEAAFTRPVWKYNHYHGIKLVWDSPYTCVIEQPYYGVAYAM